MAHELVRKALNIHFRSNSLGQDILDNVDTAVRHFKADEVIYRMGDDVTSIYCITEGWVTTVRNMASGERQLLNFHVPVDLIGFEYLSRATATSDLVAYRDSTLVSFPISQLKHHMFSTPEGAAAIASLMSRKFGSLQTRLCILANGDALDKVAHFLQALRAKQVRNGDTDPDTLRIPLTQRDIADTLGITSVTVSRTFTKLEKQGVVDFSSQAIRILDNDKLMALTDDELTGTVYPDEFD